MFSEKIMKQIRDAEAKKRKAHSGWDTLATILALGVIGPLYVILWNRYALILGIVLAVWCIV